MPRRKKFPPVPDYTDGGRCPETHIIQKSNPLMSLSQTNMTLPELKILDAYLDRINSHDEEKRTVQFKKGEIESYLGLSRILKSDLEKRLRHLAQVVRIEDDTKPKGFKLIALFEEIDAWQDNKGLWQISLTCTNKAREYIFNLDNIGYFRYRLKNIINLTSRYSYVLYIYLEQNNFRRSWEIDISDLQTMMKCTADTYRQYYRFNDLILKRCQKEIHEKTDCRYTYEPIKNGRKIAKVRFTVKSSIPDFEQVSFDELPHPAGGTEEPESRKFENETLAFLADAVEYQFDEDQMQLLFDALASARPSGSVKDLDLARYDLLSHKFHELQNREKRPDLKPVKNRLSYLCRLIRKEAPEN